MFDFISKVPAEWVATLVVGVATAIGNKIWNKVSAKTDAKLDAALKEARSVISQLVRTAAPGTTMDQLIIWCKGAVAIQLAKHGIDLAKHKLAASLVQTAIAEGVALFVELHPDKPSLKPPVLSKLGVK